MIIIIVVSAIILLSLLIILLSGKTVAGNCPACHSRTSILGGIGCCQNCGEALKKEGEGFVAVQSGFIPDNTVFLTNLSKLKKPWNWQPTWKNKCIVCGSMASKTKKLEIKSVEGHYGSALAPENATRTTAFEIGYCIAHRDGMRFSYPPGMYAKNNSQCLVSFRSVDFYRQFMKENGLNQEQVTLRAAAVDL